jgi:hypothetical protein
MDPADSMRWPAWAFEKVFPFRFGFFGLLFPNGLVNRSGLVWIIGVLLRMARLIVGA